MRVAVYLRVSTEEQAQGVDTQERGVLAWCAAQGHAVVATYRDIGVSGAEWKKRPAMIEMRAAARQKPRPWDLVVVRDVDRLGRDGVELMVLLTQLRDVGVTVVESSSGQPVSLEGMGKLIASVKACLAEIERETIAQRVRTAHANQHAVKRVVGGACYGYDNVRGEAGVRYAINDSEAAVVREIFARLAGGEGCREVARSLNARGVAPPSAGRRGTGSWSPGAVYEISRRERYKGVLAWGRAKKGYREGTRQRTFDGEVRRVEAPELALVDVALWERVNADRDDRRRESDRPVHRGRAPRHLLIGHVTCAACGGPVGSTTTKRGKTSVPAYRCAWCKDRGVCAASWRRPAAVLDEVVRDWLLRDVLDEAMIREAVALARARLVDDAPDPRLGALQAEEREHAAAIGRLAAAVEVGGDVPELVARMRERREQLAAVRRQLSEVAAARAAVPADIDDAIGRVVTDLRARVAVDVAGAREVLGALLVGRLKISWEGPRGRVWIEGRAELGAVLRATVDIGVSPGGSPDIHRPAIAEVTLRRCA